MPLSTKQKKCYVVNGRNHFQTFWDASRVRSSIPTLLLQFQCSVHTLYTTQPVHAVHHKSKSGL